MLAKSESTAKVTKIFKISPNLTKKFPGEISILFGGDLSFLSFFLNFALELANLYTMTEEIKPLEYDRNATMRGRTLIFIGIAAGIVAALMFIFRLQASASRIVVLGGVLFVGAGVFNLLFFNNGKGLSRLLTSLTNSAAIVLGVCMLVFRSTFVPMVPFIFGLLIAFCALWQFYALAVGIRPFTLPAWYYVMPLLLVVSAVYIFIRKDSIGDIEIVTLTGASLAVFALAAIVEGVHTGVLHRKATPEADDTSADLDEPIGEDANGTTPKESAPTTKE